MLYAHFTTSEGNFTARLFDAETPNTVANFTGLADGSKEWTDPRSGQRVKQPYYNGTVFHRVISNFVAQGGGFDEKYAEKPVRASIPNESGNGLSNRRGTVGLARTADPHSGNSQFYLNIADNGALDPQPSRWGYAVFGRIVQGMDVVDDIGAVATGEVKQFEKDVPLKPVIIIRIVEVK